MPHMCLLDYLSFQRVVVPKVPRGTCIIEPWIPFDGRNKTTCTIHVMQFDTAKF